MKKYFLEIGSSSFDTCRKLAENGWKGAMVEPIPEVFQDVKDQNEGLDIENINLAISDFDGEIDFAVPKIYHEEQWVRGVGHVISNNHKGMNGIGLLQSEEGKGSLSHIIRVECKKLDTLIDQLKIDHIDFLKIDIEGHELNVIDSYSWRIEPSIIKIEHCHLGEVSKNLLFNTLSARGYLINEELEDFYCIK